MINFPNFLKTDLLGNTCISPVDLNHESHDNMLALTRELTLFMTVTQVDQIALLSWKELLQTQQERKHFL